jgi:hypothetical protein
MNFNDEWTQKLEKKMVQLVPLIIMKQPSIPDSWSVLLGDLGDIFNVIKQKLENGLLGPWN